nr:MAG TPA: hypothetical protein [Caudoviricetes sp.]
MFSCSTYSLLYNNPTMLYNIKHIDTTFIALIQEVHKVCNLHSISNLIISISKKLQYK